VGFSHTPKWAKNECASFINESHISPPAYLWLSCVLKSISKYIIAIKLNFTRQLCNLDRGINKLEYLLWNDNIDVHVYVIKRIFIHIGVNLSHSLYVWYKLRKLYTCIWGTRWRSWLRHCATNWRVTSSIRDGVIGIFHWHNPSSCTIALGSTQPFT
jgi:hypothetical protein